MVAQRKKIACPGLSRWKKRAAEEGVSAARLIAGLVVALVALGLVVGGVYWLKQRAGGPGTSAADPTLIAAAPGPYKVKPADAGGMQVKGQGDSSYAASEGADPNAKIDLSAIPEAPVAKGKPAPGRLATAPASGNGAGTRRQACRESPRPSPRRSRQARPVA